MDEEYEERMKYLFDEWKHYYELSKKDSSPEEEWLELC